MNTQIVRIGDDLVAFHAIVTDDGITLVDAGLPGDMKKLERALAGVGRSVADIRGVVLTHGDRDHIGIAEELRREHGIPSYIHEDDAERAKGAPAPKSSAGGFSLGPALQFAWTAISRRGYQAKNLTEVRTFPDDTTLDLPGNPVIVAMPGHSPGSVAVRVPSANAIFLGDAVTTRHVMTGSAGAQPAPFTDDEHGADLSRRALVDLPETRLFPGHGPEFQGTMADLVATIDKR